MSADHLDLIRRLRDVGTGAIDHAYQGLCPCVGDGIELRDPDCKACDVVREADALLEKTPLGDLTPGMSEALFDLAKGRAFLRAPTGAGLVRRGLARRVGRHHEITDDGRELLGERVRP